MPSERSTKSASVVPVVVVATMTVQYRNGWKRFAAIWTLIATIRMAVKIAVPTRYPRFMDMVTASPPVSPNVVARIFTTQNASVTAGTLLERSEMPFMICIPIEPDSAGRMVATRVDSLGRARSVVSSPVHDREQIAEGLLAIGGVRGSGAQGLEGAVDRLVDLVPLGSRPRLQSCFSLVPRRFQILDAGLCAGEIAFVDERCGIRHDGPERRKVAEFRWHRSFGWGHDGSGYQRPDAGGFGKGAQ